MEKIRLLKPTMEYADDIMQLRHEIIEANDPDAFAGCGNLEECKTAQEWIDTITLMENPDTCPAGRVPSNMFIAVRALDNKIVGVIDLRHHLGNRCFVPGADTLVTLCVLVNERKAMPRKWCG